MMNGESCIIASHGRKPAPEARPRALGLDSVRRSRQAQRRHIIEQPSWPSRADIYPWKAVGIQATRLPHAIHEPSPNNISRKGRNDSNGIRWRTQMARRCRRYKPKADIQLWSRRRFVSGKTNMSLGVKLVPNQPLPDTLLPMELL